MMVLKNSMDIAKNNISIIRLQFNYDKEKLLDFNPVPILMCYLNKIAVNYTIFAFNRK